MFRWVSSATKKHLRFGSTQRDDDAMHLGDEGMLMSEVHGVDASASSYSEELHHHDPRQHQQHVQRQQRQLQQRQGSNRRGPRRECSSQRLSLDGDSLCSEEDEEQMIQRRMIGSVVMGSEAEPVSRNSADERSLGSTSGHIGQNSERKALSFRRAKKRKSPFSLKRQSSSKVDSDDLRYANSEDGHESLASRETLDDRDSGCQTGKGRLRHASSTFLSNLLRQFMGVMFVYIAIGAPFAIFTLTHAYQRHQMEVAFETLVDKVGSSTREQVATLFKALDGLSITATTNGMPAYKNQSAWPYITVDDFDLHGYVGLQLSNSLLLSYMPLLNGTEQRNVWEQSYIYEEGSWLTQAFERSDLSTTPGDSGDSGTNATASNQSATPAPSLPFQIPFLWTIDDDSNVAAVQQSESGQYLPMWQYVPLNDWLANLDLLDHPDTRDLMQRVLQTGNAVLGHIDEPSILPESEKEGYVALYNGLFYSRYNATYTDEPTSWVGYPIFDSFPTNAEDDDVDAAHSDRPKTQRRMVGVLAAIISWEHYLKRILPMSVEKSVMVVLQNECNIDPKTNELMSYSFALNGGQADYVGVGDHHDRAYEYLRRTILTRGCRKSTPGFTQGTICSRSTGDHSTLQAPSIDIGFCPYIMHIYPTDQLQNHYITNEPVYYAFGFLLFCVIFFSCLNSYDWAIRWKVQQIWDDSQTNQEVISKLFPEQFRKQLMQRGYLRRTKRVMAPLMRNMHNTSFDDDSIGAMSCDVEGLASSKGTDGYQQNQPLNPRNQLRGLKSQRQLRHKASNQDLRASGDGKGKSRVGARDEEYMKVLLNETPIADLFLRCTVCFADISGFSAWSSERDPEHVFTLLECVFQTMDAIARKRGVFKVETISDSYMAVTGLPDPQFDHAVRMCRFARDCMTQVRAQTRMLESRLGPDTGDLQLRVGMHSGQVTAGVLRGEKTRFQLFGDTVNTAARMESTSHKNRIQVSEATAALLRDACKSHWLTEREDEVHAKGKGLMKTFWLASATSSRKIYANRSDDKDSKRSSANTDAAERDDVVDEISSTSQTSNPSDSDVHSTHESSYHSGGVGASNTDTSTTGVDSNGMARNGAHVADDIVHQASLATAKEGQTSRPDVGDTRRSQGRPWLQDENQCSQQQQQQLQQQNDLGDHEIRTTFHNSTMSQSNDDSCSFGHFQPSSSL